MTDNITYDEVMAELEKYVVKKGGHNFYPFTAKMDKLILKSKRVGVSYVQLQGLWKKLGWGNISTNTLRARYLKLTNGHAPTDIHASI